MKLLMYAHKYPSFCRRIRIRRKRTMPAAALLAQRSIRIRPFSTITIRSTTRTERVPHLSTQRAPAILWLHRSSLCLSFPHSVRPLAVAAAQRVLDRRTAHRRRRQSLRPNCSGARRNWIVKRRNWNDAKLSCATVRRRRVATIGHRFRRSVVFSRASIRTYKSRFQWNFSASCGTCTICGPVSVFSDGNKQTCCAYNRSK